MSDIEVFQDLASYRTHLEPHLADLEQRQHDEYLATLRDWAEADLYFFLRYILSVGKVKRKATGGYLVEHPFIFDRCRDVQGADDRVVDIWAREHFKSTIKTLAKLLWDVIHDPEQTIAVISNTLKGVMVFAKQLEEEMTNNKLLPLLWPSVFYENPRKDSPRWALGGNTQWLQVKREGNPKEATLHFYGLDSALPTGPHFGILHYDDIVTRESVTNEDRMATTLERWQSSLSLGREGGKQTYAGTFYHEADAYNHMRRELSDQYTFRIHPARDEAKRPVFYTEQYLADKRRQIGEKEWWTQWMCDPLQGESRSFALPWFRYYKVPAQDIYLQCSGYMLVDPANEKVKRSDFTVIMFVGVGPDGRWRVFDIVRDRLDPAERVAAVIDLYDIWGHSNFIECRYEKYGLMSDTFWLRQEQERQMKQFSVVEVAGKASKSDRIDRLVPQFKAGNILFPERIVKPCEYRGGAEVDLVQVFLDQEYTRYPLATHDDMLDCLSRMCEPDMPLIQPSNRATRKKKHDAWDDAFAEARRRQREGGNWISPSLESL